MEERRMDGSGGGGSWGTRSGRRSEMPWPCAAPLVHVKRGLPAPSRRTEREEREGRAQWRGTERGVRSRRRLSLACSSANVGLGVVGGPRQRFFSSSTIVHTTDPQEPTP